MARSGSEPTATRRPSSRDFTNAAPPPLADVNHWLWNRAKHSKQYGALSEVEKAMAEELHELVTWGVIRIQRTRKWQPTTRGDLLEGNTLFCAGKAYLIRVFEKLTDGYLRYGVHRPSDAEFAAACRTYQYRPRTGPFTLEYPRTAAPAPVRGPPVPAAAPAPVPAPGAAPRAHRHIVVAPNRAAPPVGNRVVLTPQTRLRFFKKEIDGLPPETTLELRIRNPNGTTSDPRPLDLVFRCTVAKLQTFFDFETDGDWNNKGTHSWSRFPRWAEVYIVEGTIGS